MMKLRIMKRTLSMILIWAAHAMAPCLAEPTLPEAGGTAEPPGNLPKVLLIGDSISGGYSKAVKRLLDGQASVTGPIANAEATIYGVAQLDNWLGDTHWDLIHFNWGLWDIYGWKYAKQDRSPAMYEKRLETLVARLKKTGAKLIWATTTPVCPGAEKTMLNQFKTEVIISPETERLYRDAALRVMKKNGIEVNDLYAVMAPQRAKHQADDNVHFSGAGYGLLAKQVANCIVAALNEASPANDGADAGKTQGRFIGGHVHFHDRAPGDLDRVAEWMVAMNIQRCINHPLRQSRPRNENETEASSGGGSRHL